MANSKVDIRRAGFLSTLALSETQGANLSDQDLERRVRLAAAGLTESQGAGKSQADLRRSAGIKRNDNAYFS